MTTFAKYINEYNRKWNNFKLNICVCCHTFQCPTNVA